MLISGVVKSWTLNLLWGVIEAKVEGSRAEVAI